MSTLLTNSRQVEGTRERDTQGQARAHLPPLTDLHSLSFPPTNQGWIEHCMSPILCLHSGTTPSLPLSLIALSNFVVVVVVWVVVFWWILWVVVAT